MSHVGESVLGGNTRWYPIRYTKSPPTGPAERRTAVLMSWPFIDAEKALTAMMSTIPPSVYAGRFPSDCPAVSNRNRSVPNTANVKKTKYCRDPPIVDLRVIICLVEGFYRTHIYAILFI
jgi:hypothetical protein